MHCTAAPSWRALPFEEAEPAALLAGADALLDGLASDPTPTLRWYRPARAAIVLGRGQRRLAVRPADDLQVLHRSSGGGAVLFDADLLSLDVALPRGHPWLSPDDLGAVFVTVGRRWAEAVAGLGLDADVHEGASTAPRDDDPAARLRAAVCYASVGRGEVTVGGRKVVGLAQRRRRHGALVQCGLLRRWRPAPLLAALVPALAADGRPTDGADRDVPADPAWTDTEGSNTTAEAAPGAAEITDAAIGLDDALGRRVDDAEVIAAVEAALR